MANDTDWNVLTSSWLEAMTLNADVHVYSPLEALRRASEIRCIAFGSPLDLFAAHRFLLTLLYWKADAAGGVEQLRKSLLNGELPHSVLDSIEAGKPCFGMFDTKAPFMQDPTVNAGAGKSAGSLFAEFASGTNIAHFHHGDDKNMRLCVGCATMGMLRVVPWTPSGGAGLSPSIHNSPPVVALAMGPTLAVTLGLNLVPLPAAAGEAKWSGHFIPTGKDGPISYLEALTWNPRRVCLGALENAGVCWRCGRADIDVVGPVAYEKNEETKKRSDKQLFEWQDPAAFYGVDEPYKTMKSSGEERAGRGEDLGSLLDEKRQAQSAVIAANPDHQGWKLIVPCTNPANNKTFDHRQIELQGFSRDALRRQIVPADSQDKTPALAEFWASGELADFAKGHARFVRVAAKVLTQLDWSALSAAAYGEMHDSPAAFDVFSGLLWSLRGKVAGLPSKNVGWLVLKLMASVPSSARKPHADAVFCPLLELPRRQPKERRKDRSAPSPYPIAPPRGIRLESDLRQALDRNMRQQSPERVDWASLCLRLDQLLD